MDDDKKHAPTEVVDNEPEHHTEDIVGYSDRPSGWMYKSFSIFGTELWYASPKIQLLMIAIVCFLCPGMFNSLSGLGGAGQVDANANADMNTALYSTFAVVGFFAGTFTNRLGLRFSLSLGGIGYCIYSGSLLCYNHTNNRGFLIFAGAFLGVCAGLLWCAQGAIMMAYPREQDKGKYISWFWIIFNLGAVLGSLVSLAVPASTFCALLHSFLTLTIDSIVPEPSQDCWRCQRRHLCCFHHSHGYRCLHFADALQQ